MDQSIKRFFKEAHNESGKYSDRSWVKVNSLHSVYVLRLKRVQFGTEEHSDNSIHLHYCGYVGIPESHPLYKKSSSFGGNMYMDDDVEDDLINNDVYAHGGITFTGFMTDWGKDYFFIGFDCAHINDVCSLDDFKTNGARFRSWDMAKTEIEKLYEQLTQIESNAFVSTAIKKEDEFYAKKSSQTS